MNKKSQLNRIRQGMPSEEINDLKQLWLDRPLIRQTSLGTECNRRQKEKLTPPFPVQSYKRDHKNM